MLKHQGVSKFPLWHYGIIIALLSFVALLASLGIRGSFGVYVVPWENSFSTNRIGVTFVSFISLVVYGIGIVIAGKMTDKFGSRIVLTWSMALMGVGLVIVFLAQSIWQIAFLYGVIASLGFGGASNVTVSVAIVKWFKKTKAL